MDNEQFDFDGFDFDDAIVTSESIETIDETEVTEGQNKTTAQTGKKPVLNETTAGVEETEEEEVDETTKTTATTKETTANTETKDAANFIALAKFYASQGKIKEFDEKDFENGVVTWDQLTQMEEEALEERLEGMLSEYKQTLQPITKRIEDLLEAGVDEKEIVNHFKEVKAFQKISKDELSTNEELQKSFLKQYFKETTSLNDKKIDNLIKLKLETADTEDLPELYDEYTKILQDKEKQMKEAVEAEEKAQEDQIKNTVASINKYIEESKEFLGVKLSPQLKEAVRNEFKTVKLPNGGTANPIQVERAKNPVAFDFAVRVCKAFGLLNIDDKGNWNPDLKKFKVNMTSKVTQELAEQFGNGKTIKTGAAINSLGGNGTQEDNAKELEAFMKNL